jgi:hypothetical protein
MIRISNTIIAYASLIVAIVLILHHGYKHRPGGEDPLYGHDQYFQLSDVGNFQDVQSRNVRDFVYFCWS